MRFNLEIDQPVSRDLVEHMVENGTPVASFCWPVPSRLSFTRICVSLVLRTTSATRMAIP